MNQKKPAQKKLTLNKETLRILKDSDLRRVAGGAPRETEDIECVPYTQECATIRTICPG